MRLQTQLGIALAAATFLAPLPLASAQSDDKGGARPAPRRQTGFSGVRSQPGVRSSSPGRMSGLGGVRSQPGVKSEGPRGVATPIRIPGHAISRPPLTTGSGGLKNPGDPRLIPVPGSGSHPPSSNRGPVRLPSGFHRVPPVGEGLDVSGSISDGPFTLVFHTGGGHGRHHHHHHHKKDCGIIPIFTGGCGVFPYWPIGSFYSGYGVAYGYDRGYYERPVLGEPAPSAAPTVQPEPLSAEEHAAALLRYGDSKAALNAYRALVKTSPNNSESLRGLGLALIDSGETGDGVAVIGMAYRADATLAINGLTRDVFGSSIRLRSNLSRVSQYANREKSASAWLTLAALMQAEGRNQQAYAMVERAKAAGLEDQIAQEMASALMPGSQIR